MTNHDSTSDRDPVERLAEEYAERHRRGENPTLTEYTDRYPDWAEIIRELFPAVLMMEQLKPATIDGVGRDGPVSGNCPTQLGDYRIIREVGRGGMGVVYEAFQESLGRHVALKVLPLHGRIDSTHMQRFRLEARSAARLHHTNIVPVFGIGQHDDTYFYAMQFIRGTTLEAVLRDIHRIREAAEPEAPSSPAETQRAGASLAVGLQTGRLPGLTEPAGEATVDVTRTAGGAEETAGSFVLAIPPTNDDAPPEPPSAEASALTSPTETQYYRSVARIGRQVAEALAFAHAQGVLHRDIKPANLMLDASGHVWVTDFGLAKIEGTDEGLTSKGDVIGTIRYMAPERFDGWSDPRSDVYGLGVTLYEMTTLRPVFEGMERLKLIDQIQNEPPTSPRKLDPNVPRDLETIILKAMAKEPADRYQSAHALAEDLKRFAEDRPIKARRSRPPEILWRWCRRNPALAALTASVALLLVVLAVGSTIAALILKEDVTEATRLEKIANRERDRAVAEHETGRRYLYAADMQLASRAWEEGQIGRVQELLDEPAYRPTLLGQENLRGWEWHYLNGLCHKDRLTLQVRKNPVDVAFSPDGRWLATANWDSAVVLWDLVHDRRVRVLTGHDKEVQAVAFSPDSLTLASAGNDGTVKVWDVNTGHLRYNIVPSGHEVIDGRQMLRGVAFSPDGRFLVTAGWDGLVYLFDTADWREIRSFPGHTASIMTVAFSPDGRRIASAGHDFTARIWDVATGRTLQVLAGHTHQISQVAFSPDGRTLATSSEDETARLWDMETGRPRAQLKGHTGWVYRLAFSPDGMTLATASYDGTVKLWDTVEGREIQTLRGHTTPVACVAFHPSGRWLASAGTDGVKLWDLAEGPQDVHTLRGHTWPVVRLAFSPDGRVIASASRDRTVRLWDAASGRTIRALLGHLDEVWDVAFSPDGRMLASVSNDRTVKLWDVASGRLIRTLAGHASWVRCVRFSPDGHFLASAGIDGEIRLWNVADGRVFLTLRRLSSPIGSLAVSPDGRRLATAHEDGTIALWDVRWGRPSSTLHVTAILRGHDAVVCRLAFHPDGRMLASGSADGTVKLWDSAKGRELFTLKGHSGSILGIAFSPSGRRLASAGSDRRIRLWDVGGRLEVQSLKGVGPLIYDVAFSPDGRWLASANSNQTLEVWDATPVKDRRPLTFAPDAREFNWHLQEAEAAEASGQWFAAATHLDRLAASGPRFGPFYYQLGRAHAEIGRYDRAIDDFARAIELGRDDPRVRYALALSCLAAGRTDPYRRATEDMVERYGQSDDLDECSHLTSAYALAPDPPVDPARPLAVAERLAARHPGVVAEMALAKTLYRAGRFEESIRHLDAFLKSGDPEAALNDWYAWLWLAMAHHRLGHLDEARRWLDQAERSIETLRRGGWRHTGDSVPLPWNIQLSARLLLHEAESLIRPKPDELPTDLFAHPSGRAAH